MSQIFGFFFVFERSTGCDPLEWLRPHHFQEVCVRVNPMGIQVYFNGRLVCKNWFSSPVINRPGRRVYMSEPWTVPAHVQITHVTYTQLHDPMNPVLRYWRANPHHRQYDVLICFLFCSIRKFFVFLLAFLHYKLA